MEMNAKLSTLLLILGLTVAALVWGQAPELTPKSARETDTAAPPTVPPQTPAEMTAADVEAFLRHRHAELLQFHNDDGRSCVTLWPDASDPP